MNTPRNRLLAAGIAAALAVCSAASAQSVPTTSPTTVPAKTFGWRGDGTGRYPDANPPLSWGRVAKSVKELSAQAGKPKEGAAPAKEAGIPDGVIRHWLVLAPVPVPADKKVEDLLLDAKDLSPDADDKSGDLKWKPVDLETNCMDLRAITGIAPDQKGFMAYAHAYVYSPSDQAVAFNFLSQGQGTLRLWLNGEATYDAGKNLDCAPGVRLVLGLKKGWNRLLVLNAKTIATRRSWWFTGSLYGEKTQDYESHGIVWSTQTPAGGTSAPVIAGDRIFFTAESGSLYCVNKADGKILWIRSLTYYDFATPQERKANPEIFAELDSLAQKVKQLDETDRVVPWKAPPFEKDQRGVIERQIFKGMAKVSQDSYDDPTRGGVACEAGYTPCTPVTDGGHVYAVFGTGIAACYDREGNCQWKRLLKHKTVEHGYSTSPLLVDGRLVIYFETFTELDARTGEVLVDRPHYAPGGKWAWFWGSGLALSAGDEKVLYYPNKEFVRLSDGKTLPMDPKAFDMPRPKGWYEGFNEIGATSVVDNGIAYVIDNRLGGVLSFKLPAIADDKAQPKMVQNVPFNLEKFPYYYETFFCASPLVHEGLMYCLDDFGVLTVADMVKGDVAYQKLLDIEVYMPYVGAGALKGGASSSPTLAGKYIYIWGNQGTCVVIEPGRTFKQVARNRIDNFSIGWPAHQDATSTEPIFEGDRMYYRGEHTLHCIGPK